MVLLMFGMYKLLRHEVDRHHVFQRWPYDRLRSVELHLQLSLCLGPVVLGSKAEDVTPLLFAVRRV
jgi:hypothetical protein